MALEKQRRLTEKEEKEKMYERLRTEAKRQQEQYEASQSHLAAATQALASLFMGDANASAEHESAIEREQRVIAQRERDQKLKQERFEEELTLEERRRRETESLKQRDSRLALKEAEAEARRQANREAKQELANAAHQKAKAKMRANHGKFREGEVTRKLKELERQDNETNKQISQAKDEVRRQHMFMRDEAQRASLAGHKAHLLSMKLKQGKQRQRELEEERKAAEHAEKKRQDEARREFHEAQRRKKADDALFRERHKRLMDETAAAEARKAVAYAEVAKEQAEARAVSASMELQQRIGSRSAAVAPLTSNRTAYDAKNRAKYGVPTSPTGDSAADAPLGLMLKFW